MSTNIEAGGGTLKISYLRFISDAAPGLLLIVVITLLHSHGLPCLAVPGLGKELKALLAVAALLLAVPVGLVVNGASHLLLGSIQTWMNRRCFRIRSWTMSDTHRSSLTTEWSRCFAVEEGNWPAIAETMDELLLIHVPQVAEPLDHVRALKKLLRSMALLALFGLVIKVINGPPDARVTLFRDGCAWGLLIGAVLAMALGGYVTFYQHASVMMRAYLICGLPAAPVTITLRELDVRLQQRAAVHLAGADQDATTCSSGVDDERAT